MEPERLQKVIAASGICSRREAEALILKGSVRVNERVITELGTKIRSDDEILVHGKPLPRPQKVVYALHKPRGIICSRAQQATAEIVTNLVPKWPAVFPVGRLDKESEGLLILTNDGNLTQQLTHPSKLHSKEYWVQCHAAKGKIINPEIVISHFKRGVKLGDGKAQADAVEIRQEGNTFILSITVHEGRTHLIRRMCATEDLEVDRLKRVKIGKLSLDTLRPGQYKTLSEAEVRLLHE